MQDSNNMTPAANNSENFIQALKQQGFDFCINQNGTPQSNDSRIPHTEIHHIAILKAATNNRVSP